MRKLLSLCLAVLLLFASAWAEETPLAIEPVDGVIHPGKAMVVRFTVPRAGEVSIYLMDDRGAELSVVTPGMEAVAGLNQVWWNGTYGGVPAPRGSARLVLCFDGQTAEAGVTVGDVAPYLTGLQLASGVVTPAQPLTLDYYASCAGRVTIGLARDGQWTQQAAWQVSEGPQTLQWLPEQPQDGEMVFTIQLSDAEGDVSNEEHFAVTFQGFAQPAPEDAEDAETGTDGDEPEDRWLEELRHWQDDSEDEEIVIPDGSVMIVEEETVLVAPSSSEEQPAAEQTVFTPSHTSPYAARGEEAGSYWTLPMDITDTEAVWQMLIAPVTTVYDGSKAQDTQKRQTVIRKEPSEDSVGVGVVTNLTQSVRVLERGEEWSLIECYSSSFFDSKVKAWNMLVQGYVPTRYLRTVTPNQHMGMVIDKLTQRLYIFVDGELYDTLLCSTGLANERQPYNETRSGEFLLQNPAVGGFPSDSMICSYGIRFNGGDLLHEVPHVENADGSNNYKATEPKLGTKCSHGCVRVQRLKTPKGTNMLWLWNNRKDETKLVIWEDWQGRQIAYPDDDMALYYNPNGGVNYHTAESCYSAKGITFTPFTYAELDSGDYAALTRCPNCVPPLRKAEIDEINRQYAPGGDHDPILTAAQQKFLAGLEKQLAQ